ncbi:hypothetical protein [Candidatus Uabimicrobium amorphum]|nr:hypothetical protein [Candidatus Uabimicrobium amorphum]
MRYLQETESVLKLLYKLNRYSDALTYYIYVVPIFVNNTEKHSSSFANFGAFSVELKDKLCQSRFSAKPTRHDDRSSVLIETTNRYIICTRRQQRTLPPNPIHHEAVYLSFPVLVKA